MKGTKALALALALLLAFAVMGIAGCAADEGTDTSAEEPAGEAMSIALLLPETKTARYETQDKPLFEERVAELNPDIEILYSNANQDAALLKRNILRDSIDFYHKTGSMGGVLHDWGFTTSARIFLFTSQIQDERALLPIFGAFGEWLTNSQNS